MLLDKSAVLAAALGITKADVEELIADLLHLQELAGAGPDLKLANLAALLPDEAAKWLVALCKSFDLFTFWTLILLAMGFAAVNPKKLKGAKAFTIAFSVWAVYVVCRVGWAFIFS